MPASVNKPPFWRFDWPQNNLLLSAYHLSDENLMHYYRKISKFAPEEVIGHPSSIYTVAYYIVSRKLKPLNPKVVITTAETLLPYQRETIEKAFKAPLVDQYGCTEMAFFGSQCQSGTMHFHPEHAIVEIEKKRENPESQEQEYGEVVATNLINYAMPLIRYKVSDTVHLEVGEKSCHPGFPVIKYVEGRVDDTIYTKDGRKIGRLSPVFRSDKKISNSKIIQGADGNIDVYIVLSEGHTSMHRRLLMDALRERIGDSVEISITVVPEISKESNGKFRPVVSYFKP
jgi:phenylacetate-CoA ligase